jgi:hypothetical protein
MPSPERFFKPFPRDLSRDRLRARERSRETHDKRKNYLIAGSDTGGERAAIAYTILGSCRLVGVNPVAYLTDILPRLGRRVRLRDLPALLPARGKAERAAGAAEAQAVVSAG